MLDIKKYKKKVFMKYFCVLGIFILTIFGFILLRTIEDRKISYDISKTDELKVDDKVYVDVKDEPVRFYLYDVESGRNKLERDYYYCIKDDNIYLFETERDVFEDFLNYDIESKNLKKKDDKIIISGYIRETTSDLIDKLNDYAAQNELDFSTLNVNHYMINTRFSLSRDRKSIFNFFLYLLAFIGIPLYMTRKNYKVFNKKTKNIDLDILSKTIEIESKNLLNYPFIFSKEYLIILEDGDLFGRRVINLGMGNYQTIGNTFGIFKYTDIKHMVVEANRVLNDGEYYILYIVLKNNECITYRSRVGENKEIFDNVVRNCLEFNPEIRNNPEDKDYAKAFIIKYFKRVLYIVWLLVIYMIYLLFIMFLIFILF